jgi:hypothetical protein
MQQGGVTIGDTLSLREGSFLVNQIYYCSAPEDMFLAELSQIC